MSSFERDKHVLPVCKQQYMHVKHVFYLPRYHRHSASMLQRAVGVS